MKTHPLPISLTVLLIAYCEVNAQVNGIPDCAKQCALDYLSSHPDCPLTTQTCICGYLSYYSSCIDTNCNGTDMAAATQPPIPYYIPEATISIASATGTASMCPLSMTLNTPTFVPTTTAAVSTSEQQTAKASSSSESSITSSSSSASQATGELPASVTAETSTTRTGSATGSERTTAPATASRSSAGISTSAAAVATFTGTANTVLPRAWSLSLYGVLGALIMFYF